MRRPLLVLLLAAAVTGCGSDEPVEPATSSRSSSPAALVERVELGTDGGYEWRLAIAPDGQSALFAHSRGFFPRTRESTIYEVRRERDGWSDPVEVPFVGADSADIDPVFSADGRTVWFSSIRPVDGRPRTDVDVWRVERQSDGGWGVPVNAGAVNSAADDLFPSLGPDGSLYVGSDRGGSGFDVVRSAPLPGGGWAAAEALPEPVTTSGWEFNPAFTPDGRWLVYTALDAADGRGKGDLLATRPDGTGWTEPVLLEEVSTSADEYHPSFSPDGDRLTFVRDGKLLDAPLPAVLRRG